MKTTQTWGWLAAGVLAAGMNATYHDGGLEWAHRAADQVAQNSAAVLALASGQTERFLAEAQLLTAQDEARSNPVSAVLAQVQARVGEEALANVEAKVARCQAQSALVEVMSAREEAQLARIEVTRAKIEARLADRVHVRVPANVVVPVAVNVPAVCPRVRVNVPPMPRINVPAPVIHVETPGAGPV